MEAAKKFQEFNVVDPRESEAGAKHQLKTQAEAEAKAAEIGSANFTAKREDGSQVTFEQKDGKWLEKDNQEPRQQQEQDSPKASGQSLDVPEEFAIKAPNTVNVVKYREEAQANEAGQATAAEAKPTAQPTVAQPSVATQPRDGENQIQLEDAGSALEAKRTSTPPDVAARYDANDGTYTQKGNQQESYKDSGDRLETQSNGEGTARDMIRVAESRGWQEIRVAGSETFRQEAWREAASRGMEINGYSPTEEDKKNAADRAGSMAKEVIQPENQDKRLKEQEQGKDGKERADAFLNMQPREAVEKHPELAGSYAAMSAIQRKAQDDKLSPEQQEVVSQKVKQNIASALGKGHIPAVKLNDQDQKQERQQDKETELER